MSDPSPSTVVYSGSVLRIGEFRCPPAHSAWREENLTRQHLVVFPRVAVWIEQAGRPRVVADPNTVMFYNARCSYRRGLICERGDECEWFAVPGSVIADAAADYDPAVADRPDRPFAFDHAQASPSSYLVQRRIYECARLAREETVDRLALEETFVGVLRDALGRAYRARGHRAREPGPRTAAAHRASAEAVKALLARRFAERLSLDEISDEVELSPFHLCRVFRRHAGMPIHRYRNRLRVRAALEAVADEGADLTDLALRLGFSSHSHFTSTFKREFGVPPAAARRDLRRPGRLQPRPT